MSLCDISIVPGENTHAARCRQRSEMYEYWQWDINQRTYTLHIAVSNPPGFHWLQTMRWEVTGFTEGVCDFHWRMGSDSICVRGRRGLVLCRHLIACCLNSHHSFEHRKRRKLHKQKDMKFVLRWFTYRMFNLNYLIKRKCTCLKAWLIFTSNSYHCIAYTIFKLIRYLGKYAMMDTWIFGNYQYLLLCTLLFHSFIVTMLVTWL